MLLSSQRDYDNTLQFESYLNTETKYDLLYVFDSSDIVNTHSNDNPALT